VQDIVNDEDILWHYFDLATSLYAEEEDEPEQKQFELKLVH
jgi:hypothetical protein